MGVCVVGLEAGMGYRDSYGGAVDMETLIEVQRHRDTQHQHPMKPKARLTVYTCMGGGGRGGESEGERKCARTSEIVCRRWRWCARENMFLAMKWSMR